MENDGSLIMWIARSRYRRRIVECLLIEEEMTPTELSKKTKLRTGHISKVLKDLKDKNVVLCSNEEVRKGRLYRLTDFGRNVVKDDWRFRHLLTQ